MSAKSIIFAGAILAFSAGAKADEATQIQTSHAWIRLLPGDLPAAGYVTLQNTGNATVILVSAKSVDFADVMLHQSTMSSGTSQMTMVDQLPIPAHQTVALAPAGYHLMLSHPKHALKSGDSVALQLRFADGSVLNATFAAKPANALGD